MLERLERVGAVGVEDAMTAIVEAKNVTGGRPRSKTLLRATRDWLQVTNELFHGLRLPVARKQGPHDGAHREFRGDFDHPGVAKTKRWPEPFWYCTGRGSDCFVASLDFAANCVRAEPKEIWMRFGVIGNYVATGGSFPEEIGTLANVFSDDEKRGAGFVLCEEIEKFRS